MLLKLKELSFLITILKFLRVPSAVRAVIRHTVQLLQRKLPVAISPFEPSIKIMSGTKLRRVPIAPSDQP